MLKIALRRSLETFEQSPVVEQSDSRHVLENWSF